MPAGPWVLYNDFIFNEGNKQINLATDVFKVALFAAGSSVANPGTAGAGYSLFATAGEVPPGTGYTTGGYQVMPTWTGGGSNAVAEFSTTNPEWTAVGGLTAGCAVLYSDTAPGKVAVAYCELDTAGAVTVPDGQKLKIQITKIFRDTQAVGA